MLVSGLWLLFWVAPALALTPTPASTVYIFDLTPTLTVDPADAYEVVHTVTALQVGECVRVSVATHKAS